MVFVLFLLGIFSSEKSAFVPQEIRCLVPKFVGLIQSSESLKTIIDTWKELPKQCENNECSKVHALSQDGGGGYILNCKNGEWRVRLEYNEESDSTCWAGFEILFQLPLGYSTQTFKSDFKFVPWGEKPGWLRAKEYALYMSMGKSEDSRISGRLSGRSGTLRISRTVPLVCTKIKQETTPIDSLSPCEGVLEKP